MFTIASFADSAYVLAGGRSSRFGTNKAYAFWQGQRFLHYQVRFLQDFFAAVHVVGPAPDAYQDLGFTEVLVDRFPLCGPLAGLDTALQCQLCTSGPGWVFLASCDTFGVTPEQIQMLCDRLPVLADERALLWSFKGRLEPLWGFYHTDLAGPVEQALIAGDYGLKRFLASHPICHLMGENPWIQVNMPQDLKGIR